MAKSGLVLVLALVVIALTVEQAVANKGKKEEPKAVKQESAEPLSDAPEDNTVQIHFMDHKRSEFLEALPKVKDAIAESLSKYCADHTTKCGITGPVNFTQNDVHFLGSNDKERFLEDGRYIIAKMFASVPGEAEAANDDLSDFQEKVISQPILEEFFAENSQEIAKAGGVPIAFVNDKLVYPPRNNLDNYIIVTVSCVFCVVLVLINLICQRISNNKLKKSLFKKKPIYNEGDDKDGEITALNKTVSQKPSGQKQVTQANYPGSHDYQLARTEARDNEDRRSNSSHGSRHRNSRPARSTSNEGRQGARESRYQNEYRDEVDEVAEAGPGERFPMPDRKPLLYTTSVNTSSDPYSNTLDISTRIRLTQV